MKQNSTLQFHLQEQAENIWQKFLNALPVIVFFLAMFYLVIWLFGMQYVMVVSLATLLFQVNYKKQQSAGTLVRLIIQQLFLVVLAYMATLDIFLSLILNLIVPFWLIFSKASPFNQLGYFSSLMTFTFMQMMHMDWHGFTRQFTAMVFCYAVFFVVVFTYTKVRKKAVANATEQKSMKLLGAILEKAVNNDSFEAELKELSALQRELYQEAYQMRGRTHVVTAEGKLKYMFAILVQRSVYFVSGESSVLLPIDEKSKKFALQTAQYMKLAGEKDFMNGETDFLNRNGRRLLKLSEKEDDDFYLSSANFFRMFLLILRQSAMKDQNIVDNRWKVPLKQRIKERFLYRLRPDTFEMRFTLRMSMVLMTGMSFIFLFPEGHSYWFVMNAFLLLRPMYEDSNYRMKTRFLGTAAGCIIVSIILPFCGSISSHLLIAGIMVVCMYTATPGTILHAVFVTCFALTMTTLAMGVTAEAAFLRLLYVVGSVLFVLIVNRFFFPTSFKSQLKYNLEMLFHMHHMYLRILEDALSNPLDYWRLCDAQLQYHMVHAQIRKELPRAAKEDEKFYLNILSITWRMASEIQQMFFHVTHKKRTPDARHVIQRYIYYTDFILNQIQEMLHLKKEKYLKNVEGMKYQRYVEGEPKFSQLMTLYAHNLSRLYVCVLQKIQK